MNLRQLECFVAVVEEGSFTRAARRVGIAQPSLSQHIRALEEELNGSVLDRLPHGAALTPAGRGLLPEARAALRAVERAPRRARRARARGRRARDRDRALDGGRACCRATSGSGTSATRTSRSASRSSATARSSRMRSSRASPTSRSGRSRARLGGAARDRRVGGVRARRAAGRPARRPRARPARGARRPRVGALPPGPRARRHARPRLPAAPGSARADGADVAGGGCGAPRLGRARARRSSPTTSCCPASPGACCASSRGSSARSPSTARTEWSPTAAAFVDVLRAEQPAAPARRASSSSSNGRAQWRACVRLSLSCRSRRSPAAAGRRTRCGAAGRTRSTSTRRAHDRRGDRALHAPIERDGRRPRHAARASGAVVVRATARAHLQARSDGGIPQEIDRRRAIRLQERERAGGDQRPERRSRGRSSTRAG